MNTFIEIKSYATKRQFSNRGSHNNRSTNLSNGKYKNEPYINFVEKYAAPVEHHKNDVNVGGANSSSKKSRSDYTNEISKSNHLLKKLEKDLKNLELKKSLDFNNDNIFVLDKKITKKTLAIKTLQEKIMGLEILRNGIDKNYSKSNSQKNRKEYVEFTLTITDVPKEFKRDTQYKIQLKNLVNEYLDSKGFKFKKSSSSVHLDQSNPHVHLLASYDGDNNLHKDLKRIYGAKDDLGFKTHYNMQKDFNKFVKEHALIKSLDWKIDDIVKGGANSYLQLPLYKSIQANSQVKFDKYIQQEIAKNTSKTMGITFVDYQKIFEKELPRLKKLYVNDMLRTILPLKNDDEYKAIYAKKEGKLRKYLENQFEVKEKGLKLSISGLMDDNIELKRQNKEYKDKDENNTRFTNDEVIKATLAYEKEIKTKDEKISSLESSLKSSVPKSELDKYKKVVKDNDLHSYFDEIGEGNPDYKNKSFGNR